MALIGLQRLVVRKLGLVAAVAVAGSKFLVRVTVAMAVFMAVAVAAVASRLVMAVSVPTESSL